MTFYGLGEEGPSPVLLGGGVELLSGAGEAGHEAGDGNSFMVTVTRLVVTSVTTTSLQLGAISGCQSGSPSAGTLLGSAAAEPWSPGTIEEEEEEEAVGGWHFGWDWLGFLLAPSLDKGSTDASSSSSSMEGRADPEGEEREGDEGRTVDADAAGFASEDGSGAVWPFWVSA